jgi:hypothetical protein
MRAASDGNSAKEEQQLANEVSRKMVAAVQ